MAAAHQRWFPASVIDWSPILVRMRWVVGRGSGGEPGEPLLSRNPLCSVLNLPLIFPTPSHVSVSVFSRSERASGAGQTGWIGWVVGIELFARLVAVCLFGGETVRTKRCCTYSSLTTYLSMTERGCEVELSLQVACSMCLTNVAALPADANTSLTNRALGQPGRAANLHASNKSTNKTSLYGSLVQSPSRLLNLLVNNPPKIARA
ncbi:hypothetical protein IWZ01DRAFT_361382 [Phyllosticta capitalensis]